jgi:hypothetical protein
VGAAARRLHSVEPLPDRVLAIEILFRKQLIDDRDDRIYITRTEVAAVQQRDSHQIGPAG